MKLKALLLTLVMYSASSFGQDLNVTLDPSVQEIRLTGHYCKVSPDDKCGIVVDGKWIGNIKNTEAIAFEHAILSAKSKNKLLDISLTADTIFVKSTEVIARESQELNKCLSENAVYKELLTRQLTGQIDSGRSIQERSMAGEVSEKFEANSSSR